MNDHDVIVAGAGPAGLLLASLLAQAGRDVVVFERRTGPDERTRAIGIHPPGLAALRAAGIETAVRAEAMPLAGAVVTSGGQILADVGLMADSPVLTLAQPRTTALLLERLERLLPEAVRRGCTVLHARDDGDGVRVSVAFAGIVEQHRASLLVVAEGVHSSLRDRLGFGWRRVAGTAYYSMADLLEGDGDGRVRLHLERDGVVESFPLPAGGRRWVLRERERRELSPASFRREIRRRCGIDIGVVDPTPATFRARQHRATRVVRGRVALLGDAAHEISPIGGQGMNLAWIAACRLAVAVTDRDDLERALASYERMTLRAARAAQHRALFNMAMGAPWPDPPRMVRDAAIRGLARGATGARLRDAMTMQGL